MLSRIREKTKLSIRLGAGNEGGPARKRWLDKFTGFEITNEAKCYGCEGDRDRRTHPAKAFSKTNYTHSLTRKHYSNRFCFDDAKGSNGIDKLLSVCALSPSFAGGRTRKERHTAGPVRIDLFHPDCSFLFDNFLLLSFVARMFFCQHKH